MPIVFITQNSNQYLGEQLSKKSMGMAYFFRSKGKSKKEPKQLKSGSGKLARLREELTLGPIPPVERV